jgi:hypothetical protein
MGLVSCWQEQLAGRLDSPACIADSKDIETVSFVGRTHDNERLSASPAFSRTRMLEKCYMAGRASTRRLRRSEPPARQLLFTR